MTSTGRMLITGGTGYLGRVLCDQAYAQGWEVAATYFTQPVPITSDIAWFPLDVRDAEIVDEAVDRFRPDVVIHTAFRQHEPGLWDVTARGSQYVAAASHACGARLIHMSSDVIFDGERATPYTPADAPSPINAYGRAKADAEHLVRTHHPKVVIVRTSLMYGFDPLDRHTSFVLDVADSKHQLKLFRDEYRCPILVTDLAAALLELSTLSYTGVINIAGADAVSRYEFGTLLAAYHGRDPSLIPGGFSSESDVPRPRNCRLDSTLAQQLLQTPLRGVRSVLQRSLKLS